MTAKGTMDRWHHKQVINGVFTLQFMHGAYKSGAAGVVNHSETSVREAKTRPPRARASKKKALNTVIIDGNEPS